MNGNDIINAMEHINDKYIAEFADTSQWKKKRNFWLSPKFYGSIAAIVTIGVGLFIVTAINSRSQISPIDTATTVSEEQTSVSQESRFDPFHGITDIEKNFTNDTITETDENINKAVEPLFSLKVYAAENSDPVELLPEQSVIIKGDFNPLFSSSRGLGIEFEITCPAGGLTLQADNGHFISWDSDSGAVTNYGKIYSASGLTTIFWTLSGSSPEWDKTTLINVLDSNETIISVIEINGDEKTHTFSAKLTNA